MQFFTKLKKKSFMKTSPLPCIYSYFIKKKIMTTQGPLMDDDLQFKKHCYTALILILSFAHIYT